MIKLAIAAYVLALVIANLTVAHFGPSVTPINAFCLIGLDLALRNFISLRLSRGNMALMILGAGLISYAVNPASGMIAVASCVAFTLASLVDWLVFNTVRGAWLRRNFAGNSAGALIDSVVFPTLAFGALMPEIIVIQFVAKVLGGTFWGLLLNRKVSSL